VGQAQAQVSQAVGTNNGVANTGGLGQEAKLYITESVRSAIDGIIHSSLIPRLNSIQAPAVIPSSSKSARMLNGVGKENAIAFSGLTI